MASVPVGSEAPRIDPIPAGARRPLWSVMIPAYNCAGYLKTTLASVLRQDPGADEMQIEVVDDCSTRDDPEAVVREVGGGRVLFHRKARNEGVAANFNTCIERAKGHLVHILHGDDWVADGFYSEVAASAAAHGDCEMFSVRAFIANEAGEIERLSSRQPAFEGGSREAKAYYYGNPLFTPSIVIRRRFYEARGGFLPHLSHCADWEMWIRATANGGHLALNLPLASYRFFSGNHSSRLVQTGENLVDYLRLGAILARERTDFSTKDFRLTVSQIAENQGKDLEREGLAPAAEAAYRLRFALLKRAEIGRLAFGAFWHRDFRHLCRIVRFARRSRRWRRTVPEFAPWIASQ
jgi:glycosyltransferase involved in cell wall biosynthesis